MSLPSRGRGLKSDPTTSGFGDSEVAPFTGAWIEIESGIIEIDDKMCRSLHGGVD